MCISIEKLNVVIAGGDLRQFYFAEKLVQQGVNVTVVGLKGNFSPQITLANDLTAINKNVHAIIFPVPGIAKDCYITPNLTNQPIQITEAWIESLSKETLLMVGKASTDLKTWCSNSGISLIEYMDNPSISILNSIPTAEASIQIAMDFLPTTIFNSNALVFGLGKCGLTLATLLSALGANTTVVVRKTSDVAKGRSLKLNTVIYQDVETIISDMDIIFNTVPALVLTEPYLRLMKSSTPIIDIASAPGGVDFKLAEELGINAILALGLPGKYSPKTAGEILADIIPDLIVSRFSLPDHRNQGVTHNEP